MSLGILCEAAPSCPDTAPHSRQARVNSLQKIQLLCDGKHGHLVVLRDRAWNALNSSLGEKLIQQSICSHFPLKEGEI